MIHSIYFLLAINYWYNPSIHNFGNTGILGNVHAALSPLFTKIIDKKAYNGVDIRKKVYNEFKGNTVDLCCGTGFSTKPGNLGVDTSREMLRYSNFYNPGSNYVYGNAETFGKDFEFDSVSCMFAFHEIPKEGHEAILKNCIRISKENITIVDISTSYKPSKLMLSGEPYILDYISTIDDTMERYGFKKKILIPGHVESWTYSKPI